MNFYRIFLFVNILLFGGLTKMNAQSLPERINDKDVFLVDVRSVEEFESGTAKNAINIPLQNIEKEISQFKDKKNIVLFCRKGKRAEEAKKILARYNISAINGKTVENVKSLQKGNVLEKLTFRNDKQITSIIKKGENIKQIAVALGKNAILKKHTTDEPTFLVVLKGKIRFLINNEEISLNTFDTYDIPVDIEHEVIGVEDENIFILTKGEW